MARFLSPRRSLVFGFLLTALVLAAQQPVKWDALLSDSIAAIKAGNATEAIELLLPLYEQAKAQRPQANALPADDVRRVETALVLATAYQYHGQLNQAEPLYPEAIQWLETGHGNNGSMLAPAFRQSGAASSGAETMAGGRRAPRKGQGSLHQNAECARSAHRRC